MSEDLNTPGQALFPDFARIAGMYEREVEGMSDAQYDAVRPEKSWGAWSIRQQVSHIASALLKILAVSLRVFGNVCAYMGGVLVAFYDLLVFGPLWLEGRFTKAQSEEDEIKANRAHSNEVLS